MILLTGASGYIGSRLLRVLEEGGTPVRCLARDPSRVVARRDTTQVVAGDGLDEASLDRAMKDVDQALHDVVAQQGGLEPAAATEYVKQLKKDKRYQRDVY